MKIQNIDILQKRINLLAALAAVFTGIVVAVVCLISMYGILKNHRVETLRASLLIHAGTVDQYVANARETGLQITSRSVIRKKLEDFNAGLTDVHALRALSLPKLRDALNAADQVLAIRRFDLQGRPVLEVAKNNPGTIDRAMELPDKYRTVLKTGDPVQVVSDPFACGDKTCFTVTTPIKNSGKELVGTDVVLIDFDQLSRILADKKTEARLRMLFLEQCGLFYDLGAKTFRGREHADISPSVYDSICSLSGKKDGEVRLTAPTAGGTTMLFGARRLKNANWTMVCGFDEKETYRPVYVNLFRIAIFLVPVILGGLYLTRRLLKPYAGAVIIKTAQLEKEISDRTEDLKTINTELHKEIAERRHIEENLRKSEARLKEAEKIAHLVHWEYDLVTGVLYWSHEIYRLFELPDDGGLLTMDVFASMIHPEDRERVLKAYNDSVEKDLPYDIVHRIVARGGGIKYVHEQCVHERDEAGKVIKSFGTVLDVTEAKRAESLKVVAEREAMELRKKESLRKMAGAVAHHLNNAMTGILGGIELALNADFERRNDFLHIAKQSADKAAQLGKLLLMYLGQFRMTLDPVPLDSFFREFQRLEFNSLPENIEIRYEMAEFLPHIEGDAELLKTMIRNLIENAIEATAGKQGVIVVSCQPAHYTRDRILDTFQDATPESAVEGDYVRISIADNGVGIDQDYLKNLLDPFFSTKLTGRGLGLPVAEGIVKAHHGFIRIESEKDKGTVVTIIVRVQPGATSPPG